MGRGRQLPYFSSLALKNSSARRVFVSCSAGTTGLSLITESSANRVGADGMPDLAQSRGWLRASMQTVIASRRASSSPGAIATPYVSRTANQRFETVATVSPLRVISYS